MIVCALYCTYAIRLQHVLVPFSISRSFTPCVAVFGSFTPFVTVFGSFHLCFRPKASKTPVVGSLAKAESLNTRLEKYTNQAAKQVGSFTVFLNVYMLNYEPKISQMFSSVYYQICEETLLKSLI